MSVPTPQNAMLVTTPMATPRLLSSSTMRRISTLSASPGWAPSRLPWGSLDVDAFTQDQRYAIAYWFALLSVFVALQAEHDCLYCVVDLHALTVDVDGWHVPMAAGEHPPG